MPQEKKYDPYLSFFLYRAREVLIYSPGKKKKDMYKEKKYLQMFINYSTKKAYNVRKNPLICILFTEIDSDSYV